MNLGIAGYGDIRTGLGNLNCRFWQTLQPRRWLLSRQPQDNIAFGHSRDLPRQEDIIYNDNMNDESHVAEFLDGLDVVLFVERPMPERLPYLASLAGIKTVCLVMAEWFAPSLEWIRHTTAFVAPTSQCLAHLREHGFGDRTIYIPCPTVTMDNCYDPDGPIVFTAGFHGGADRKGWPEVADALWLEPDRLQIKVFSQKPIPEYEPSPKRGVKQRGMREAPPNALVHPEVTDFVDLYRGASLIVAPSRFEGAGLSIIEGMMAGVPVMTTNAPPMNEYIYRAHPTGADRLLVNVDHTFPVNIWHRAWRAHVTSASDLAAKALAFRELDRELRVQYSREAREYAAKAHFDTAWRELRALLERVVK